MARRSANQFRLARQHGSLIPAALAAAGGGGVRAQQLECRSLASAAPPARTCSRMSTPIIHSLTGRTTRCGTVLHLAWTPWSGMDPRGRLRPWMMADQRAAAGQKQVDRLRYRHNMIEEPPGCTDALRASGPPGLMAMPPTPAAVQATFPYLPAVLDERILTLSHAAGRPVGG